MISIKNCINEQELLDICLELCSTKDEAFEGPAGRVITLYVSQDLDVKVDEIEERLDEVTHECQKLIAGKVITELSLKGLVDTTYDDQAYFSLSKSGERLLRALDKLGRSE